MDPEGKHMSCMELFKKFQEVGGKLQCSLEEDTCTFEPKTLTTFSSGGKAVSVSGPDPISCNDFHLYHKEWKSMIWKMAITHWKNQ